MVRERRRMARGTIRVPIQTVSNQVMCFYATVWVYANLLICPQRENLAYILALDHLPASIRAFSPTKRIANQQLLFRA
jgi:hypothetical protein